MRGNKLFVCATTLSEESGNDNDDNDDDYNNDNDNDDDDDDDLFLSVPVASCIHLFNVVHEVLSIILDVDMNESQVNYA